MVQDLMIMHAGVRACTIIACVFVRTSLPVSFPYFSLDPLSLPRLVDLVPCTRSFGDDFVGCYVLI